MKKVLYKIASTLMAVIVLLSTMSFTVEKHFCGDFLVDVSFVGDVEKCNMDKSISINVKKKNCCKDEVHHIEGQDELQKDNADKLTFSQQKFVAVFTFSYYSVFTELRLEKEFYKDFSPPDLNRDIQVLYQTFLI